MNPLPYNKAVEEWHKLNPDIPPYRCMDPRDDDRFVSLVGGTFIPAPQPKDVAFGSEEFYWLTKEAIDCRYETIHAEELYPGEFYKTP